jgi:hypothetical protein
VGLRAISQIAKLSRELEKAEAHGGKICLPSAGKAKAEQLADAGIATPTARCYEQLAAPTEEQLEYCTPIVGRSVIVRLSILPIVGSSVNAVAAALGKQALTDPSSRRSDTNLPARDRPMVQN